MATWVAGRDEQVCDDGDDCVGFCHLILLQDETGVGDWERLLGGSGPFVFGFAVSCPANAKATTGFMLSTIAVGIAGLFLTLGLGLARHGVLCEEYSDGVMIVAPCSSGSLIDLHNNLRADNY